MPPTRRKPQGARVAGACPGCAAEATGLVRTVYRNVRQGYTHRRFVCRACGHAWVVRTQVDENVVQERIRLVLRAVREAEDALMHLRAQALALSRLKRWQP